MPLAEMMTLGQRERASRSTAAASSTMRTPSPSVADLARRHAQQPAVLAVQRGGLDGHRAVQVDRQVGRDLRRALQPLQHQHQRLRAAHRERGSSTEPPRCTVRATISASCAPRVLGRVQRGCRRSIRPAARRRAARGCGRRHQQVVAAAQVAREHQRARRRARSVTAQAPSRWPAGVKRAPRTSPSVDARARRQRHEAGDARAARRPRCTAAAPGVARKAVAVGAARVFFLQVRAVEQQHLGQVARGRAERRSGPRKPCFTSAGSQPLWSRWAWLSTTASSLARRHRAAAPSCARAAPCSPGTGRSRAARAGRRRQVARAGDGVGGAEKVMFMFRCPGTPPMRRSLESRYPIIANRYCGSAILDARRPAAALNSARRASFGQRPAIQCSVCRRGRPACCRGPAARVRPGGGSRRR